MAYQGEDWIFTLKGDENINLSRSDLDFQVLIYPCGYPDKYISIPKSKCKQLEENKYRGRVRYEETKKLEPGIYSLEVLFITPGSAGEDSSRSVFKKVRAFENQVSASKNVPDPVTASEKQ